MYAVLHAFLLWHKYWKHGRVIPYGDNSAVINGINNKSIKGPAIRTLQTIILLAAAFDIELVATWIPMDRNVIADAASRFDYPKLKKLGLTSQVNLLIHRKTTARTSTIRQTLSSFFTTQSRHQQGVTTKQMSKRTGRLLL